MATARASHPLLPDEAERRLGFSLVQFELSRLPQRCYCVPHGVIE